MSEFGNSIRRVYNEHGEWHDGEEAWNPWDDWRGGGDFAELPDNPEIGPGGNVAPLSDQTMDRMLAGASS